MKQDVQFNMNCVSKYVDRGKMYVIQSKNEIIINLTVNVKNYVTKILLKVITYVILGRVIVNIRKHAKLMNIQILIDVNCSFEKHLIGKLVLKHEDEILT